MSDVRPVRLQLSRRKGFDLQAVSLATNGLPAVKVDRASGFGNPFPIFKGRQTHLGVTTDCWEVGTWNGPALWFRDSEPEARKLAIEAFRAWIQAPNHAPLRSRAIRDLRGKNLACWCKLGTGCHADVLLEFANAPICEAV